MKRTTAAILLLLSATALTGCVAPTLYQSATAEGGGVIGYKDKKLDANIYRISFTGNAKTSLAYVQLYALYRTAELARDNSASHFEVLEGGLTRSFVDSFTQRNKVPPPIEESPSPSLGNESKSSEYYDKSQIQVTQILQDGTEIAVVDKHTPPALTPVVYVPMFIYVPTSPVPQYSGTSLLVRLQNVKPADMETNPNVFDTADVLARLGPYIHRPVKTLKT